MADQARRAAACGDCWARMELPGVVPPDGDRYMRLQLIRCGQRVCPSCGKSARMKAGRRLRPGEEHHPVGVQWKTLVTLTLPHTQLGCSPEEAWESIGRWVGRWLAALRRRNLRRWPDIDKSDPRMHYAWVVEAHPRGHPVPHVHLVLSMPYPRLDRDGEWFRWSREAWAKITGCHILPRVMWKQIWSEAGMRNYLVPYLTKCELTPSHYAVMYRRRMYGSTLPANPKPEPEGWVIEEFLSLREVGYRIGAIRTKFGDRLDEEGPDFLVFSLGSMVDRPLTYVDVWEMFIYGHSVDTG